MPSFRGEIVAVIEVRLTVFDLFRCSVFCLVAVFGILRSVRATLRGSLGPSADMLPPDFPVVGGRYQMNKKLAVMMKVQPHALGFVCLVFCLASSWSLAATPSTPQEYADAIGTLLGQMDAVAIYKDACKEQFPETAGQMDKAYAKWHSKYADVYAEVTRRRLEGYRVESHGNRESFNELIRAYDENFARGRESVRQEQASDPNLARKVCRGTLMMMESGLIGFSKEASERLLKQLALIRAVPEVAS